MANPWIGFAREEDRPAVAAALAQVSPGATLLYARSASELRRTLHDEEPRRLGVVVGPCYEGVSAENVAAALVHDGFAREVVLAARDVTGSLSSRALKAGISRVVALGVPVPTVASVAATRRGAGSDAAASAGRKRSVPVPVVTDGPDVGSRGQVITLVSGRGGVGKTTICALMATIAGSWGMSVALLDLDLACGNLASLFPVGQGCDLAELAELGEGADLEGELARRGSACASGVELWGPCSRPELAETVMPLVTTLIDALRQTHGLVIVDTSSTCTDAVAQAMQEADRLVCVQGRGASGVASLARVSALAVRLGVARTRIVRVENLCEPRHWGRPFEPTVEVGLETARGYRLVEGTADVLELVASGSVEELTALEDDLSRSVATLLGGLLSELGCLPEGNLAERSASGAFVRKAFPLFGRRKEAV